MQDIMKCMSIFCQINNQNQQPTNSTKEVGMATQTEIVAVHTPQVSDN